LNLSIDFWANLRTLEPLGDCAAERRSFVYKPFTNLKREMALWQNAKSVAQLPDVAKLATGGAGYQPVGIGFPAFTKKPYNGLAA